MLAQCFQVIILIKFIVPKKFSKSVVNDNHVNEVSMVENIKKRDKTYILLLLLIIVNIPNYITHTFIFNLAKNI